MIQVTTQNLIIGSEWVKLEDAIKEQSPAFSFESGKIYRVSNNSSNTLWETETANVPEGLEGAAIKSGESFNYDLDEGYSLYVKAEWQSCSVSVECEDKAGDTASAVNAATSAITAQGTDIAAAINKLAEVLNPQTVSLEINPATFTQDFYPESYNTKYFNSVRLNAVTSSVDANITADNIKSGVSILGVTGSYEGTVINNQDKTVTENGTVTADSGYTGLGTVTVNVAGGSSSMFGLTINDFVGTLDADGTLRNYSSVTSVTFTGVKDIGDEALRLAFTSGKTTSLKFPDLETLSGAQAIYGICQNTPVSSVEFPKLTTISGDSAALFAFQNSQIESIEFPALTTISGSGALWQMLSYCYLLTSVSFPALTAVTGNEAMGHLLQGTSQVSTLTFPALTEISGQQAMTYMCQDCTGLTSLSFPELKSTSFGDYTNQFNDMLSGVTGCTVHFPSNLKSVIGSWTDVTAGFGGTDTTVLYDLDATE